MSFPEGMWITSPLQEGSTVRASFQLGDRHFPHSRYLLEYLKGGKTLPHLLVLTTIVIIPMAVATFIFLKNNRSNIMKYVTLAGYFVLYAMSVHRVA